MSPGSVSVVGGSVVSVTVVDGSGPLVVVAPPVLVLVEWSSSIEVVGALEDGAADVVVDRGFAEVCVGDEEPPVGRRPAVVATGSSEATLDSTEVAEVGTTNSVVGRAVLSSIRSAVGMTPATLDVESPGCGCQSEGDAEGSSDGKTTSRTANALTAQTPSVIAQASGIVPRRATRAVPDQRVAQVEVAVGGTASCFTASSCR